LFRTDIEEDVVEAVRRGKGEFALVVESSVIILAYRFEDAIPWEDVPYTWHLQPEDRRVIPLLDASPEARSLLWIALVGADDGIIHAQRGMTLSPAFGRALKLAIREQAMMPFSPTECTSAIRRLCLEFSHPADRLSLAVARTMGNE